MYLLNKLAFPRIAQALDRRQRAIEESIEASERTRREADQLLAEYRERLAEARGQADEIVARARRTGEAAETEIIAEARAKREEMMEQTRRDIEAETRRAIQEIRAEVADLTVLATEKVARKALTDEDQRRLVDEALSELDFASLAHEERTR
jgi:F-type H+-transporting ATPase subunit b